MHKKKRSFSLLEIIIVIFLITLITGAVGYNMKGALDRGRAFRTEQAKEQLEDLLLMCFEEERNADQIIAQPGMYLKRYGLAKNPDKLIQDGWGVPFDISFNRKDRTFKASSKALSNYKRRTEQQKNSQHVPNQ